MKNKIIPLASVFLLALQMSACAADIDGRWIARTLGGQGTAESVFSQALVETIFNFKADETSLTGTVKDSQGEAPISEGKINRDEISFVITRSFGGNEVKLLYKGKVALNEIQFTREIAGTNGRKLEFIARREFPRHGDIPLQRETIPVNPPPRR